MYLSFPFRLIRSWWVGWRVRPELQALQSEQVERQGLEALTEAPLRMPIYPFSDERARVLKSKSEDVGARGRLVLMPKPRATAPTDRR